MMMIPLLTKPRMRMRISFLLVSLPNHDNALPILLFQAGFKGAVDLRGCDGNRGRKAAHRHVRLM
jgi:hypothetical protein